MTKVPASEHGHADAPDRPWLSVLVPAYNVGAYVEAMLASVLAHCGQGVEIVVVDDRSTDDTAAIIERFAASTPSIRVERHARNLGVAATRNHLLDLARGRYLWFVDADDVVARGAIRGAHDVVRDGSPDIVMCDFRTLDGPVWLRRKRSTFIGPREGEGSAPLIAGALRAGQFHVWSKLARRELWQAVRFPERRRFEDMSAAAQLLIRANTWRHVPDAWIGYRQRAGSLSRQIPVDGLAEYSRALGEVAATVARSADEDVRASLDYFLLRGHASIARRLVPDSARDSVVAAACRAGYEQDFEGGIGSALAACRRRGWWLRAHRIERALIQAGWR